jgi:hypothetical protein
MKRRMERQKEENHCIVPLMETTTSAKAAANI